MTIHQLLMSGGVSAGASSIVFKGSATASSTSVTIPSHATGDLIVIVAGNGDAYAITKPAGWTSIYQVARSDLNLWVAYKFATSGSEVSGTWTYAANILAAVYDGVASIGGINNWITGSSSATYATFESPTMSVSDGSSWVVGAGGAQTATYISTPPSGMTHRTNVGATTGKIALNDTASGVTGWSNTNALWQGAIFATSTFELVSE